jgi:serine/threonine protein kinase
LQVLKMINISEDPAREELYVVTRLGCGRINDPIFLKQSEDGELIKSVTQQLLEVARAMHHIGIVHFAINPSTVALFQGCHVRIKGFQSSAEIGAPREERAGDMMDRWHRAPEALLSSSSPYAASMDVYSVGCILAEMLLQRQLFGGVSYGEHIAAMFRLQGYNGVQDLGFEPDTYAASILQERCISPPRMLATTFPTFGLELCDLLSKLLTVNPTKRITAEKALRHPFFSTAPLRFPASKQVQLTPPPADFFTFDAGTALRGVQLQQLISEEVRTCATELGQDVFDPLYLPLTCR